jgi:hypothetical protein
VFLCSDACPVAHHRLGQMLWSLSQAASGTTLVETLDLHLLPWHAERSPNNILICSLLATSHHQIMMIGAPGFSLEKAEPEGRVVIGPGTKTGARELLKHLGSPEAKRRLLVRQLGISPIGPTGHGHGVGT